MRHVKTGLGKHKSMSVWCRGSTLPQLDSHPINMLVETNIILCSQYTECQDKYVISECQDKYVISM
jgi:hypothetical protein